MSSNGKTPIIRWVLLVCLIGCFLPIGCETPTGTTEPQGEAVSATESAIEVAPQEPPALREVALEPTKEPPTPEPRTEPKGPEKSPTEPVIEPSQEPPQEPLADKVADSGPEPLPERPGDVVVLEKQTPKTCQTDADCGKRTCVQSGTVCKRTTPICRSGFCVDLKVDVNDTTCNNNTGVCKAPKPTCNETCDCAQGLMCVKGSAGEKGTCIAGFVPTYCCTNPGCPTGKTCEVPGSTATSVCP